MFEISECSKGGGNASSFNYTVLRSVITLTMHPIPATSVSCWMGKNQMHLTRLHKRTFSCQVRSAPLLTSP